MTSYATTSAKAEMSELRRLRTLLPPELQSWVSVEGTTAVNPPLVTCEEIGKDEVEIQIDMVKWEQLATDQRNLLFWHEIARIQNDTIPRDGWEMAALAIGLGGVNLIGALVLGKLLADGAAAAALGGLVAFVQSIYWVLLGYGSAFLALPLVRYFWVQWRNRKIAARNETRQSYAVQLNQADAKLQGKIVYAQQFATETVIGTTDLAYTTERDLVEQDVEQVSKIDAEWQRRLNQEHK